jgi:hypothetical protein
MAASTPDEQIAAAVWFMTTQNNGPRRVLSEHHETSGGYCAGRHHPPQKWPCTAARVALQAQAASLTARSEIRTETEGTAGTGQE